MITLPPLPADAAPVASEIEPLAPALATPVARIIFAGSDDTTMASNGIGLEWDVKHIKTLSYELRVRIPNELNQENETASGLYKRHVLLCRGEKRENLTTSSSSISSSRDEVPILSNPY